MRFRNTHAQEVTEEGAKADVPAVGSGDTGNALGWRAAVPIGPSSGRPWKLQSLCFLNIFMHLFLFVVVLGIKPGALFIAGKFSTAKLYPSSHFMTLYSSYFPLYSCLASVCGMDEVPSTHIKVQLEAAHSISHCGL